MPKENRYQYQNIFVKLWRRRWYFVIPFTALSIWYYNKRSKDIRFDFKFCWSIAIGTAHAKMKWYYTTEETQKFQDEYDKDAYKIVFKKIGDIVVVRVLSNDKWCGVGRNKIEAIQSLRETIKFSCHSFDLKMWWFSRRVKFSKTGHL